jgi:hypothetical protein
MIYMCTVNLLMCMIYMCTVNLHTEQFTESVHPISETHDEVARFALPAAQMLEALPDSLSIRMHRIATSAFKSGMTRKALDVRTKLLHSLAGETLERCTDSSVLY